MGILLISSEMNGEIKMAKTTPAQFVRQVRNEFRKISWSTRKETTMSTIMVFAMVIVMGIFFLLVDQVISTLIKVIV